MSAPTLYLDSWAWVQGRRKAAKNEKPNPWPCGRSGAALTIMAMPRPVYGEHGDGRVPWLVPSGASLTLLEEALAARGTPSEGDAVAAYRAAFEGQLRDALQRGELAPGRLGYAVERRGNAPRSPVLPGATLCCACSRDRSLAGACHRAWSAPYLLRAGWEVILDGLPVPR